MSMMTNICQSRILLTLLILVVLIFGIDFFINFFTSSNDSNHFLYRKGTAEYFIEETPPAAYSVHITTWNVGGASPYNVYPLLPLLGYNDTFQPDVIVLGLQETVEVGLNLNTFTSTNGAKWRNTVQEELDKVGYMLVDNLNNLAMELLVFVKKEHSNHVRQVNRLSVTLNPIYHTVEHKAGQTIRFAFYNSYLSLTNCHFHAGEKRNEIESRVKNYDKIIDSLLPSGERINSKGYHFWFGDMNFRLKNIDSDEVAEEAGNFYRATSNEQKDKIVENLLYNDELKDLMNTKKIFFNYNEPKISFMPSYKFIKNTLNYKLNRVPSYCDRILYHCEEIGNEVLPIKYSTNENYLLSDHLPVQGVFYIKA